LIKIISGVVQPNTGSMHLECAAVRFNGPIAANDAGIVCIFQELPIMPDVSVADKISIRDPPRHFGLIDQRAQRRKAEALLTRVGCEDVNPLTRVRNLPLSSRQMVEIVKALGQSPKLLIFDEATSALTGGDIEKVYEILHQLRDQDLAVRCISLRVHEIEQLADTWAVFRIGQHIETLARRTKSDTEVVHLMIGREIGSVDDPVATLSGGNQQKVLVGKWLMTGPRISLLNDPTRGIHVGTKQALYKLLRDLAAQDAAILFYTTDNAELVGCCKGVLILYDGGITSELEGDAINETTIVASALDISTEKAAVKP